MVGPVEAVVCDFGGVLTTSLFEAFTKIQEEFGIEGQDLGAAMQLLSERNDENPLFPLERGEISEEAFLAELGGALEEVLGREAHVHRFRHALFDGLDPNPPMIELMRELRDRGLRMAMLTNNVREWEPLWRSMLPVDEIFEAVIDSGFVGCRKPEPRIYELTVERIGVPFERCLFVDDLEVNIAAAVELGMRAVRFESNEQAIPEIRAALS
ncbi:MAG: HAD family phosphatase [Actinobacteria bacterium]|nr:HAD family phosphatase [Actinomycetota bacterium]